jgi:hypothetical protein
VTLDNGAYVKLREAACAAYEGTRSGQMVGCAPSAMDAAINVVLETVASELRAIRPAAGHDEKDAGGLCLTCIEMHALHDAIDVVRGLQEAPDDHAR